MSEPEVVTIDDELPSLEIPAPRCSHCLQDVETDGDYVWCQRCGIAWESVEDGQVGKFDPEGDAIGGTTGEQPCAALSRTRWTEDVGPSIVTRTWAPCILPQGHTSDHLHPLTRTTTMKPPCGVVGGASTTRGGAPVPDMPCIREENHPGDHANGARYWPRPRARCTQQFENRYACEDCTGSPHEHHYQTGVGPHGVRVTWTTATPTL